MVIKWKKKERGRIHLTGIKLDNEQLVILHKLGYDFLYKHALTSLDVHVNKQHGIWRIALKVAVNHHQWLSAEAENSRFDFTLKDAFKKLEIKIAQFRKSFVP